MINTKTYYNEKSISDTLISFLNEELLAWRPPFPYQGKNINHPPPQSEPSPHKALVILKLRQGATLNDLFAAVGGGGADYGLHCWLCLIYHTSYSFLISLKQRPW